jgi:hypothetical protein
VFNTRIDGATHGGERATHVCELPLVGKTYYAPINTVNLLSLDGIEQQGCEYSTHNNELIISYNGEIILTAQKGRTRHYVSSYWQLVNASTKLNNIKATERRQLQTDNPVLALSKTTTTSMHQQLLKSPNHLTHQELLRAQQANDLHHILHCSDDILSEALDSGVYTNTNLTSQDLRNARLIYGPCSACYEGKATVPRAITSNLRHMTYRIGELIHVDIFSYDGSTIGGNTTRLECIEHNTEYIMIASIKSKSEDQIMEGLKSIIAFLNMNGHIVKYVSTDAENNLIKCREKLGNLGIELMPTTPGLHESISERMKRTLSERVASIIADLPYELPVK